MQESPNATGLTDEDLVGGVDLSALLTWLCELHLGADMQLSPALLGYHYSDKGCYVRALEL